MHPLNLRWLPLRALLGTPREIFLMGLAVRFGCIFCLRSGYGGATIESDNSTVIKWCSSPGRAPHGRLPLSWEMSMLWLPSLIFLVQWLEGRPIGLMIGPLHLFVLLKIEYSPSSLIQFCQNQLQRILRIFLVSCFGCSRICCKFSFVIYIYACQLCFEFNHMPKYNTVSKLAYKAHKSSNHRMSNSC